MALLAARLPGPGRTSFCSRFLLIALMTALLRVPLLAAPAREYQVKAVFLFNFAQFVDWPAAAFTDPSAPIVIGVLGTDPFGDVLEEAVRGEHVQGRMIRVQHLHQLEDAGSCHVLFVADSERARLPEIYAFLAGRSVLTVGESEGFALQGGMIRFMNDKGRIRLRINSEAAQQAGLKLSSKLLRAAEIVGTQKG